MRILLSISFCALLVFIGCSNASSSLIPADSGLLSVSVNKDISDVSTMILGNYDLFVNPKEMTASLSPGRSLSIGESYVISGLSYFTISPCADCLKIKAIGVTPDGYLELGFGIRHPFQPGDILKPPSAKNRLDLDLFDVALVIVPVGMVSNTYNLTGEDIYSGICVDVDGYTRELENVISDSAACPYYLVVDDSISGTSTFNKFAQGALSEFSVFFDISNPINFELYLTCGYGSSATKPGRLVPTYFNPEFNRKSAWKINVIPPQGDGPALPGSTWEDIDQTNPFTVTVKVWDWQHGIDAIANPPVETGDIAFASNVSGVSVEIPGMNNVLQSITSPVAGTGRNPDDPLIFEVPIINENALAAGEYQSLVKVTDERIPPTNGVPAQTDMLGYNPDGITLLWNSMPEFATYQTFTATVVTSICQPQEILDSGPMGGFAQQFEDIIRTQSDWESFYAIFDPYGIPPVVNFDENMVVVVFVGQKPSSGHYVTIDCIQFFQNLVDIQYTDHIPGTGCLTMPVMTSPFQFVLVEKWDGEDGFHHTDDIYDC